MVTKEKIAKSCKKQLTYAKFLISFCILVDVVTAIILGYTAGFNHMHGKPPVLQVLIFVVWVLGEVIIIVISAVVWGMYIDKNSEIIRCIANSSGDYHCRTESNIEYTFACVGTNEGMLILYSIIAFVVCTGFPAVIIGLLF